MLGDADAPQETVGVSQKELGTDPGPTGWSWIIESASSDLCKSVE